MAKNFIIIEPDPVVCMDVEGMLIAQYPDSHIAVGASLADIGAAVYNTGPDTTLFLRGTLLSESETMKTVAQTAATKGSHIVIIGDRQAIDIPASFVEVPFTTDMLTAAVDRDTQGSKADLTP